MDRIHLIKFLLKQKKSKNYLEIGVFNGHVFFKVKSSFKIAVDPEFQFDLAKKAGKTILNPFNLFNKYYLKTSDDFFNQDAAVVFQSKKIDVSLIDGMHEYAFALRDVENTLRFLDDDDVIIMHDCNPLSGEASIPFNEWQAKGMTGTWNGDLWKTIVHLRSLRRDLNVFVLNCDHGLGIITKRKPENSLDFSVEQIKSMTYQDFDKDRDRLLNLKTPDYIFQYLRNAKIV